jgi:hypothetical protein
MFLQLRNILLDDIILQAVESNEHKQTINRDKTI